MSSIITLDTRSTRNLAKPAALDLVTARFARAHSQRSTPIVDAFLSLLAGVFGPEYGPMRSDVQSGWR